MKFATWTDHRLWCNGQIHVDLEAGVTLNQASCGRRQKKSLLETNLEGLLTILTGCTVFMSSIQNSD